MVNAGEAAGLTPSTTDNYYISVGDSYAAGNQPTASAWAHTDTNGFAYQVLKVVKRNLTGFLAALRKSAGTLGHTITLVGHHRGLHAVVQAEFHEDAGNMGFRCSFLDNEARPWPPLAPLVATQAMALTSALCERTEAMIERWERCCSTWEGGAARLGSRHRYRKLLPDHLEMEWFLDRLFTCPPEGDRAARKRSG